MKMNERITIKTKKMNAWLDGHTLNLVCSASAFHVTDGYRGFRVMSVSPGSLLFPTIAILYSHGHHNHLCSFLPPSNSALNSRNLLAVKSRMCLEASSRGDLTCLGKEGLVGGQCVVQES